MGPRRTVSPYGSRRYAPRHNPAARAAQQANQKHLTRNRADKGHGEMDTARSTVIVEDLRGYTENNEETYDEIEKRHGYRSNKLKQCNEHGATLAYYGRSQGDNRNVTKVMRFSVQAITCGINMQ